MFRKFGTFSIFSIFDRQLVSIKRFNYSMKNIPIPSKNAYLKRLIEKVENVIKRMRWKAFFFERNENEDQDELNDEQNNQDHKYGFKSRKCPPQIEDMEKFEDDLLEMVKNIKFRKVHDEFQDSLREDIKRINNSTKALIFADKTTNLYELEKTHCDKLLHNSITSTYKKADEKVIDDINLEAKELATSLNIEDRMECLAKQQAFITLKDHKENFKNNPTCRLINPAKSEMGLVSKQILERVITEMRSTTLLNQWKNTSSVIKWFKNISNNSNHTFVIFDIDSFYPSISENLLKNAISHAKQYVTITDQEVDIIMHSRKSLLFDQGTAWIKKNDDGLFDVTMGSYDGAEVAS